MDIDPSLPVSTTTVLPHQGVLHLSTTDRNAFSGQKNYKPSLGSALFVQSLAEDVEVGVGLATLQYDSPQSYTACDCCYMWSIPLINKNNNTISIVIYPGVGPVGYAKMAVIAQGWYTYDTFGAALETALNDAAETPEKHFTVVKNLATHGYTIANSAAIFVFAVYYSTNGQTGSYNRFGTTVCPLPLTQFASDSMETGFFGGVYTKYVRIMSKTLVDGVQSLNSDTRLGTTNEILSVCICIDQTTPQTGVHRSPIYMANWKTIAPRIIGQQSIALLDEWGNNLPLADNSDGALNNGDFTFKLITQKIKPGLQ